jgi:glyceraldehyde 3-phosphate dehydrogenase
MATTRVGLMGFGRIGRSVFRQVGDHPDLEIAAIADPADSATLAYLLKYDTVLRRFPGEVALDERGNLRSATGTIPMLQARDPGDVDWTEAGVDIVLQATGRHRSAAECRKHLEAGAKRVVLADAPAESGDVATFLGGVDRTLDPLDEVVALGTPAAQAAAPVLHLLAGAYGVEHALFTVVQSFTDEQQLGDVPGRGLRMSRSAAENIIPAETDAIASVEGALPALAGKLGGMTLHVPVVEGSNVDLVTTLARAASVEEINDLVRSAAEGNSVLDYCDEPIVSSDVIGNAHSAVYDGLATLVMDGTMVKSIVWFDGAWGCAARALEVVEMLATFESGGKG